MSRVGTLISIFCGAVLLLTFVFGLGHNWSRVDALDIQGKDHEARMRKLEGQANQLIAKLSTLEEKIDFLYQHKLKELDKGAK